MFEFDTKMYEEQTVVALPYETRNGYYNAVENQKLTILNIFIVINIIIMLFNILVLIFLLTFNKWECK